MPNIQIHGLSISCQIPPSGTDECILFLHGLQSRKEIFEPIQHSLSQSFAMPHMALDFVGFGQSDKPLEFGYDLTDQQDIVLGALNQLGITKIHIIGHSRGGMLGTLMLKTAPTLVQSLISLEGNLCVEDGGESRKVAALSFDYFRQTHYPALKQRLKDSTEPSANFRQESLSLIPDYAFYKTCTTTMAWSATTELLDAFQTIPRPKLMIYGGKSHFHSRPAGTVSLAEIPDAGHFMLIDNPVSTLNALKKFLTPILQHT